MLSYLPESSGSPATDSSYLIHAAFSRHPSLSCKDALQGEEPVDTLVCPRARIRSRDTER